MPDAMQAPAQTGEPQSDLPGDSGVWVFIFADMCAFAVFFLIFSAGRVAQPALYETSRQALDLGLCAGGLSRPASGWGRGSAPMDPAGGLGRPCAHIVDT